ncbi:MAG: SRPBCC domain-containing protein [Bacteroidales bacterium]|nr:SRPBCC domain-containing protein [Bacteroidales bacterium]
MMKKVTLDYIFRTSSNILFKRLSTPSGLSEWFADDVTIKDETFFFKWNGSERDATIKLDRKALCVKFEWNDKEDEFLEFNIEKSNMTKDLTLYVTDFVEDDEDKNDALELWDNIIGQLKTKLGVN